MAETRPAFTKANSYIQDRGVFAWSLPSGWSCPYALECLTKADRETGKLSHGEQQTYRCYSAVTERFPSVRQRLWANFQAVRGKLRDEIVAVIEGVFPKSARVVRIHVAGDFFSQAYFDAWLEVARRHPDVHFYAFTKSLPYWIARIGEIPANLELQASAGGKRDDLIRQYGLKAAYVVRDVQEAEQLGLEVDDGDRLASRPGASFALLENFTSRKNKRA